MIYDTVPGVMGAADALVHLMSEGGFLLREREERGEVSFAELRGSGGTPVSYSKENLRF